MAPNSESYGSSCHLATNPAGQTKPLETMGTSTVAEKKTCAPRELGGRTLGECGPLLHQLLLEVMPLCSQHTGKGTARDVFPLPTSRKVLVATFPNLPSESLSWLLCVTMSLNSLWGGLLFSDQMPNTVQQRCLEGLVGDVTRFCSIREIVEEVSWKEFFRIRSIDYKGDEVQVARYFSWSNIAPALPAEIGRVPLEQVCTLGCKHYVENFDQYLKPESEWEVRKGPRVMVHDHDWDAVCAGLVHSGICRFIQADEIFCTPQGPLLNGLFGVTKDEFTEDKVEVYRLIMNLIPLNGLCQALSGDVQTLPSWSGMSPYFLQPSQCLLVSSEDIKCFFYTMKLPPCWTKYLAFNKRVNDCVLPSDLKGQRVYLASLVLPMGFLNSVSLAQHVHRNLVLASSKQENLPQHELRKDKSFAENLRVWRVYLDNYDLLEKVERTEMVPLQGTLAPGALDLRNQYEVWQVPRNIKKSVQRSLKTELQGATVDGDAGLAYPRESKLCKYFGLAYHLCQAPRATQRQWQVVCGGLVYFSTFRKPLLGSLNRVWSHIEAFNTSQEFFSLTPNHCRVEVLRFLGLLPLTRLNFRLDMHELVTCSDASTTGGGACVSRGLTSYGEVVARGALRGELAENRTGMTVLSIGLFDGIAALRVALDLVGAQVLGHISVEPLAAAHRVVESHFPGCVVVHSYNFHNVIWCS